MSRKRSLLPEIYIKKKKTCLTPGVGQNGFRDDNDDLKGIPNDTKATMLFLRSLFPVQKFEHRLPPIVLKHQLYSILTNRTSVDKQLDELQQSGEVKVFRLGADVDSTLLVFTEDYRCHVQCSVMTELNIDIIDKFLKTVIKKCTSVHVDEDLLIKEYSFTDEEITQLVKASLLVVRDKGSWWLSVPNTGIFMKNFTRGRKTVITMIKKCKYREILRSDLEQRKWPRIAKLGLLYHIHDIIGADLLECIQTTSGQLLRLRG